jgi:hypothetical protein
MSLSQEQLYDLMAFADGELDGDADHDKKAEVLALIEKDADARAFVNAELPRLGDLARAAAADGLPGEDVLDSFDIADAVMAKIDAAPAAGGADVVSLEAAREKRRRVGVFVATAIALAAGIALIMRVHPNEERQASSGLVAKSVDTIAVPLPKSAPTSSEASQAVANGAADKSETTGVEVNVSDSPQNGVSVFYLPGSNATAASAVVWIDESQGGKN